MKTARVKDPNGTIHSVRAFEEFKYEIGGDVFEFVITSDLSGVGLNVTHKQSGARVCAVPDSIRDNPNATLLQRAVDCLERLVRRFGEERARSIIAGARPLPPLKWLAGWNKPGCLPEQPFEEFDTFEEARDYILDELERIADDLALVAKSVADDEESTRINRAVEWIERQRDAFTIFPVRGYAYEVTRHK